MRISIALVLVVCSTVNVFGRPHDDGTEHTHSPVVAPDSESIINIEGHNEAAVHHSDVDLGNFTKLAHSEVSQGASAPPEISAAGTHHGDTHMKPPVGAGHAPTIHVQSGKTADPLKETGSVVSHGPMAKNIDHDKHHDHDHHHHDKHSTVHHAPMATEHHPKTGNAHHPQLSKTEPAIVHSPLAHPDDDKPDKTDDAIDDNIAVTSTVNHPPLATEHHPPKTLLAHHPSLSKSEPPMSHAPLAIPHENDKDANTGRKKRSDLTESETWESIEEYPFKEETIRKKRSKGTNQKSYVRKTTTTTTTVAPPSEDSEEVSEEEILEGPSREKRSKGSNQKTNVKRLTTTTTTTTIAPTTLSTSKEVFEASHRGSSEEQDSTEKKPEAEFREKRSKGSSRKAAAYVRTTTTTTVAPPVKETNDTDVSSEPGSTSSDETTETVRVKRSKGSNQKSYVRKTTTTTTTTTAAPTTLETNPSSLSEDSETMEEDKEEVRSKRSKGSQSYAKKAPLTTRNYPTSTSTPLEVTTTVVESSSGSVEEKGSDESLVRSKRSKGGSQKTQPRRTTTTTTTAKPSSTLTSAEYESSSVEDLEVTSEKILRQKRSKGSNSYKKPPTIATTKAPEPEVPASNVHHPSLSKTEPLNPAKPEEPKPAKPEGTTPSPVPDSNNKPVQAPQIIPGSHPLAIPLPTNPPPS